MRKISKTACFALISVRNNKIAVLLDKTFVFFQKLYKKELPKPVVIFVPSRSAYDGLTGRKTEDWMIADADGKKIYILDWKVAAKYGRTRDSYIKVIRHEYAHVAYHAVTGHRYPKWLNEGLACYLAGQNKKDPSPREALGVAKYFDKGDAKIYGVGTFWIKTLISKFGLKKLLSLINSLHGKLQRTEFESAFSRTYGFKFSANNLKKLL